MLDPLTQGFLTAVGQKLGQCAFDKTKEYLQRQPIQRLSPPARENLAFKITLDESGNYSMLTLDESGNYSMLTLDESGNYSIEW